MEQKRVAKECAAWIADKVQIRSVKQANLLHGKMYHIAHNGTEDAILGSSNFTVSGLGLSESNNNIELNLEVDSNRDRRDLKAWFDEIWDNSELVEDVKEEVLLYLGQSLQAVEDAFARDRGDYGRKLYLIENCLYGVDIQPIAVQIAKLRCFLGNPPYVRQEELKKMKASEGVAGLERPLKEALKADYFCYTGVADLYVYFYERAFDLLAPGGVLCFISSNKYFRAGYGEKLRHFTATNGEVHLLVDFGDEPVFTSIAYPSIILVQKVRETRDKHALPSVSKDVKKWEGTVPAEAQVRTLNWKSSSRIEDFPQLFAECGASLPQHQLTPKGWRLGSQTALGLLEKINKTGPALCDYVKGQFFNGVKTGLNDAFVVDEKTRSRLIEEHESSTEVLKPFLRGRDVKRWCVVPSGLWVIYVPWHFPPAYGHHYYKRFEKS